MEGNSGVSIRGKTSFSSLFSDIAVKWLVVRFVYFKMIFSLTKQNCRDSVSIDNFKCSNFLALSGELFVFAFVRGGIQLS